jgi:hypothetical protein
MSEPIVDIITQLPAKVGDRVARCSSHDYDRDTLGTIIEVDDARVRIAWDGGRNRRWCRRNTERVSWRRVAAAPQEGDDDAR